MSAYVRMFTVIKDYKELSGECFVLHEAIYGD